jgi:hypothetical protein
MTYSVRSDSSGLNVAARLSPPLHEHDVEIAEAPRELVDGLEVYRASSRIAVCGQPPVSTPMIRSAASASLRTRKGRVLFGVDIVGDDADLVGVAQRLQFQVSAVLPEPTGPPMPTRSSWESAIARSPF